MVPKEPMRKYLSIDEIQRQYLPISKKKIRAFIKRYLNAKMIGGRLFVERESLDKLLSDPEREHLPLS